MLIRAFKVGLLGVFLGFLIPSVYYITAANAQGDPFLQPTRTVCEVAEPLVRKWQVKLGLQHYNIEPRCVSAEKFDGTILGASRTNVGSRVVDLYLNPNLPHGRIEEVVLHELLHSLMSNMIESQSDAIHEQTVRTLTRVILQ